MLGLTIKMFLNILKPSVNDDGSVYRKVLQT